MKAIKLTTFSVGQDIYVSIDHIVAVTANDDKFSPSTIGASVILTSTGVQMTVKESVDEILDKIYAEARARI